MRLRTRRAVRILATGWLAAFGTAALARAAEREPRYYDILYEARIIASQDLCEASIAVKQDGSLLRELEFPIDPQRYYDVKATGGELGVSDTSVLWRPAKGDGTLRYSVHIDHLRDEAQYDARATKRWALLRASDLFPPGRTRYADGSHARARLRLRVPTDWTVVTALEKRDDGTFAVDRDGEGFERPTGWMLLGDLDVTRATIEGMRIQIANPEGHSLRRRDLLAFFRWTLPPLAAIVGALPARLAVVGADDPMWRGGLSGPDSVYLHADRPLIDWDGSSPVLHELVHVVTRAYAGERGDWIAEGLAEYYSLELLRRSGTVSAAEHERTLGRFRKRAAEVTSFPEGEASGAVTARAVLVLAQLDRHIRDRAEGRSLDDVLRALAENPIRITPQGFREVAERATGLDLATFFAQHR